jgi:hypothetical protein
MTGEVDTWERGTHYSASPYWQASGPTSLHGIRLTYWIITLACPFTASLTKKKGLIRLTPQVNVILCWLQQPIFLRRNPPPALSWSWRTRVGTCPRGSRWWLREPDLRSRPFWRPTFQAARLWEPAGSPNPTSSANIQRTKLTCCVKPPLQWI